MSALDSFKRNVAEVDRLINFDRELLRVVEGAVEALHDQLRVKNGDARMNGGNTLTMIRGIRKNDTLRGKYQAIYNQALVLLVSHFASALGDLFRDAVSRRLASSDPGKLLEEDFKLTVLELKEREWNLAGALPDLLIAKYDFTFQDMGATVRAFSTYAGFAPRRGEAMNNIIVAQACRHAIVHAGGRVGSRTVKQVSKAFPRTLLQTLEVDQQLALTLDDLEAVKRDMLQFIESNSVMACAE